MSSRPCSARTAGNMVAMCTYGSWDPVAVLQGGFDLPLGGRKQRTVLALLAAGAGDVVSVDALIDGLWGDEPTPGARSTLQTYISNLRQELGEVIVREGSGYRLGVEPERVDAVEFERAVAQAGTLVEADPAGASSAHPGGLGVVARAPVCRCGGLVPPRARGGAAGGAAPRRRGGSDRGRTGARSPRRSRCRARRAVRRVPAARGFQGAAHAGAVPVGPAGGGAAGLSEDAHLISPRSSVSSPRRACASSSAGS